MEVFVYGKKLFRYDIKNFLNKHNINFKYIDVVDELKTKIDTNKDDIFLIDNSCIYTPNIISKFIKGKKFDIFYKNKIEKDLLKKQNICFSSYNELLLYIKNSKEVDDIIKEHGEITDTKMVQDENLIKTENDTNHIKKIEEKKDPSQITNIDEIEEDMLIDITKEEK